MSRAAVRAWLVSRAAVVVLVALAAYLQHRHGYGRAPVRPGATSFFAWDGGWYRDIAERGYGGVAPDGIRFFPLFPLLGRLAGPAAGAALLVVANVSALAYADGLARLTARETGDPAAGERAAWLALVNPLSFVLVAAYAEALALALAVWCLLLLRRGAWWGAAAVAFLAGLSRPVGLLLAIPALVEALRPPRRDVPARVAAVAAAPLGCAAYLAWVGVTRGDPLLPFSVQQNDDLRDSVLASPLTGLVRAWQALPDGRVVVALHLVWVPFVLWLVWVAARRLPASFALYAAALVLLAVTTPQLASFERYALSAFPLLTVLATVRSRAGRGALAMLCSFGLAGYGVLAFAHLYVP